MANLIYPATDGHLVDDKYSPLIEPNLFANKILIPNITFTDRYQTGQTGQIFVHKPGISTLTPTAPGADFEDEIVQDNLIPIILNKQFNRSRKVYGVTEASVAYPIVEAELVTAINEVQEAWTLEAIKELIQTEGILVDDNITSTTLNNGSDIYDAIINTRQKMRENFSSPNTLIVSPETYGKLLKSPEFQRTGEIGNNTISEAFVGRVAGLNVFEYESLNKAAQECEGTIGGYSWSDTGDKLEYIMYESEALSIVTSVNTIRAPKEATRFVGSLAQIELVSGFKLTNPKKAALKLYTRSSVPITFNLNGGNVLGETTDITKTCLERSTIISNAPTAVRSGYVFNKWTYDAAGTEPATIVGETAKTVYAQWTKLFTATFNLNGGNVEGVSDAIVITNVLDGTLISAIMPEITPVLAGSTWTEPYWVTTSDGSTDATTIAVTANTTVYAYWVEDGE